MNKFAKFQIVSHLNILKITNIYLSDYVAAAVNTQPSVYDADRLFFATRDILMMGRFCLTFDVLVLQKFRVIVQYISESFTPRRRVIYEETLSIAFLFPNIVFK